MLKSAKSGIQETKKIYKFYFLEETPKLIKLGQIKVFFRAPFKYENYKLHYKLQLTLALANVLFDTLGETLTIS